MSGTPTPRRRWMGWNTWQCTVGNRLLPFRIRDLRALRGRPWLPRRARPRGRKNGERGAAVADADTLPPKTYANLFLAALPPKELSVLQPDLRLVEFLRRTALNEPGGQ